MKQTSAPARRSGSTVIWTTLGIVFALAPAWLFLIAAFSPFGPASASLIFAVPVLASTAIAIWLSLTLAKRGSRGAALTVGVIALIAGVLSYAAWIYLAALGVQFGNGPF